MGWLCWATHACESLPGKQPETAGLPNLPITVVESYNVYDEPLATVKTVGSNTRTTTASYDEAGRLLTSETTGTVGAALPKVTYKYSETTGAPIEQSSSAGSIKSAFNSLGQLTSYTDASGKTTVYEYEGEAKYHGESETDARLKQVNDGQGSETYAYNEITGAESELEVTGVGRFTAGYDVEGKMISEGYPNGMTVKYGYNSASEATSLSYTKESHCTEGCEWFKDSVVPSIHGQWMLQSSSLGRDTYGYDSIGRLLEATQTPIGKGCVTRHYAYDEDTNRTSVTTYSPNSKNECSVENATVEKHFYDEADRLTDTGTVYEPFGEISKLAGADAGGAELTSTFYADGRLNEQKQGEQTVGYKLDPAGRPDEVVSTGKVLATEALNYTGPGSTPAWSSEPSGKTTRMINTMSGLSAIQHGTEASVLQLTNLHGDIVATAEDSETATKLTSTISEPTEYGVPATEAPPKYSWLGAHEIPTELPSGAIDMGARSYVPQLGRFLQTDPVPGGSANAYSYTYGDPVNSFDFTGEYTVGAASEVLMKGLAQVSEHDAAEQAATNAAAREEAEREAAEAAAEAQHWATIDAGEGEEEEYWEQEEEGGYEEVAYHGSQAEHEASFGPGVLQQEGEGGAQAKAGVNSVVPLCGPETGTKPCARYADGAENGYCLRGGVHTARCRKNAAWQKRFGKREKPAGPLEKCVFGAATYGLVGLVFDVVSPEGAAATCVLAMLGP